MFIIASIALSYMKLGVVLSLLLAGITLFRKDGLIADFKKR